MNDRECGAGGVDGVSHSIVCAIEDDPRHSPPNARARMAASRGRDPNGVLNPGIFGEAVA